MKLTVKATFPSKTISSQTQAPPSNGWPCPARKDSGCLVRGAACSRSKPEFWQIACWGPWNSSPASPSRGLIRSEAITARSHPVKLLFSQPAPTLPLSGDSDGAGANDAPWEEQTFNTGPDVLLSDDIQHGEARAEGLKESLEWSLVYYLWCKPCEALTGSCSTTPGGVVTAL